MILLAVIFFGLAAIWLALITGNHLPFVVRAVAIYLVPWLAFAIWQAAQPPTGWPTSAKPPKSARFVAGTVREPNEVEHDLGEIDLWLVPADGPGQPRAYRLPYSRQLHEQIVAAMRAAKEGDPVGVRKLGQRHGPRVRFVFYRFPPPQSPAKH